MQSSNCVNAKTITKMIKIKENFKGFVFFWKGLVAAKRNFWVSVQVLIILTFLLSVVQFAFEHEAQPEKYSSLWDSIVWGFMGYLGNPGNFSPGEPITLVGRIVAILISIVGIMIFAVPAGLVANGFTEAMDKDKRDKKLEHYHKVMENEFRVGCGKRLSTYLAELQPDNHTWYAGCKFGHVKNNISFSRLLLKGLDLKDVYEVCCEYRDFRLKNEATAYSIEDGRQDRYVVEHFPVNRIYGFFKDRGSKVTIVSTNSSRDIGIGNFSYYFAKFAGFNYISKDIEMADGESYYNNHWTDEPFYEGLKLCERLPKEQRDKKIKKIYDDKLRLRKAFLNDLETLCKGDDTWVVCLQSWPKKKGDTGDIQITHVTNSEEGSVSTIRQDSIFLYEELLQCLKERVRTLGNDVIESSRYHLVKRHTFRSLLFKLQEDGCKCNGFTIYLSGELLLFNENMRPIQFEMARVVHDVIEPEHRLSEKEVKDMNRSSRQKGFADQEINKIKDTFPTDLSDGI